MSATETSKLAPLDQRTRAAILAVKSAFGVPGDWGYDTRKGDALHQLFNIFNEMAAQALIDQMEGPLEQRLLDCLKSIVDTPIMSVRDVMGNHQSPLDLYLGSFLPDQANKAAELLEEAGR